MLKQIMKRFFLFLTFFVLKNLQGNAQGVSCDLLLSNAGIQNQSGTALNTNLISYGQIVRFKVNIGNLGVDDAPAGHFQVLIGLGTGFAVNPQYNLASAPMSNYFTWSYDTSSSQALIIGTSIADIPAYEIAETYFELKAINPANSTISVNLIIANPSESDTPISDPQSGNNFTGNSYNVASDILLATVSKSASCYGSNNGSITATATGGYTPYSYTISPASGSQSGAGVFTNLPAGSYTITITDSSSNHASKTATVIVGQPTVLSSTITSQNNIACYGGGATGSVIVTATGGTTPYRYSIDNGTTFRSTGSFSGLAKGTYNILVKDTNACTVSQAVVITEPAASVSITLNSKVNNVCHSGATGTIKVTAAGGISGYSYAIISGTTTNATGASTGNFTGLAAGTYSIRVTDANGCTAVLSGIIITEPSGTVPDGSMAIANYTDNLFLGSGSSITVLLQVTESGGNPITSAQLRISKQDDYNYTLLNQPSITIRGTLYPLDNSRWTEDNSNLFNYNINLNSGNQVSCGQSVYVAIRITRTTTNKAYLTFTSVLRNIATETSFINNSSSFVCIAQ